MITFLVQEGILTVGALSGLFTAYMLNSLKLNIIDPASNKFILKHNINLRPNDDKQFITDINWQMFLKDFIIWIILMMILYLIWRYVINPINKNRSHPVPANINHIIPMKLNKIGNSI